MPTAEQQEFHDSDAWLRLTAGGVRAGKSYSTAREADKYSAFENDMGWLVGPDYEQPRAEFQYLFELYDRLGFILPGSISIPAKGPCSFTTKWGFRWETKSSKDTKRLASFAPAVIIMCEAAQQPEDAFMKVVERATQKNADVILSGTFESSMGWYPEYFERFQGPNSLGGQSFAIPSWSNLKEFPLGFDDPKIQRARAMMPEELFWERYGGKPAKPVGVVFQKFARKVHIGDYPYNPDYPIEIAVDPGHHAYAILFVQWNGPEVWIPSEIYRRNVIAQEIIPDFLAHPLSKHVEEGVMDVAGKQHQANYSQLEVWKQEFLAAGRKPVIFRTRKISETDWRNAITLRLGNDGMRPVYLHLDKSLTDARTVNNRAKGLIAEFEMYTWPRRPETANLPGRPVKLNEDALSALGYWLVHKYGPVIERKPRPAERVTFDYW